MSLTFLSILVSCSKRLVKPQSRGHRYANTESVVAQSVGQRGEKKECRVVRIDGCYVTSK